MQFQYLADFLPADTVAAKLSPAPKGLAFDAFTAWLADQYKPLWIASATSRFTAELIDVFDTYQTANGNRNEAADPTDWDNDLDDVVRLSVLPLANIIGNSAVEEYTFDTRLHNEGEAEKLAGKIATTAFNGFVNRYSPPPKNELIQLSPRQILSSAGFSVEQIEALHASMSAAPPAPLPLPLPLPLPTAQTETNMAIKEALARLRAQNLSLDVDFCVSTIVDAADEDDLLALSAAQRIGGDATFVAEARALYAQALASFGEVYANNGGWCRSIVDAVNSGVALEMAPAPLPLPTAALPVPAPLPLPTAPLPLPSIAVPAMGATALTPLALPGTPAPLPLPGAPTPYVQPLPLPEVQKPKGRRGAKKGGELPVPPAVGQAPEPPADTPMVTVMKALRDAGVPEKVLYELLGIPRSAFSNAMQGRTTLPLPTPDQRKVLIDMARDRHEKLTLAYTMLGTL